MSAARFSTVLTRLGFFKPPHKVVQRRLMLPISRSSLPMCENGPNFGFTMHASTTVLIITYLAPSSAFRF